MAFKTRFNIDEIRTLPGGSLGTFYNLPIGTKITIRSRKITFINTTNETVFFSMDKINDHFVMAAYSDKTIDISANKIHNDGFFLAEEVLFWARTSLGIPKVGTVYIEIMHE